jgi:hypothetical protein
MTPIRRAGEAVHSTRDPIMQGSRSSAVIRGRRGGVPEDSGAMRIDLAAARPAQRRRHAGPGGQRRQGIAVKHSMTTAEEQDR